jgi:hypothetical protein
VGLRKDPDMTRLLAFTALALTMGIAPVLAADTSTQPPTANTTSPEASKSATVPPSGKADTSGGATEQSSSPVIGLQPPLGSVHQCGIKPHLIRSSERSPVLWFSPGFGTTHLVELWP